MDLDHVALAATDAAAPLARFVAELGGTVLSGGQSVGFRPVQVRVGDARRGMTVELLEPWNVDQDDFLARFLAGHGDGPHHLTFKVDDFDAALDRVRETGRTPVGVNRSDPNWKEAFLVPREACGTVVQLAAQESDGASPDFATRFAEVQAQGPIASPAWWPPLPPPISQAAVLERVVLRTPDLDQARAFFVDLLTGVEEAAVPGVLDLGWPGGARLRLEAGHRSAGIDRLELAGAAPERVLAGTRVVGS